MAQIALGRLAQRWAPRRAGHRAEILAALRPWARGPCPRVREENGRALFQLCAARASAPPSGAAAREAGVLRAAVLAGARDGKKLPATDQCLAALDRASAAMS
jgi:hypothetical protein